MNRTVSLLGPGCSQYPENLLQRYTTEPPELSFIGEPGLLCSSILGFFSSIRLPGRLMLEAYEWAQAMRLRDVVIAGGFHSPMEKECLSILLRGRAKIILCPARGLARFRIAKELRVLLNGGRLLIVSGVAAETHRQNKTLAFQRNRFVAALADEILIAHAAHGSHTERLALEALQWGKTVLTFAGPESEGLLRAGARAWQEKMN